jgi:hypothetical protein
MAKELHTLKEIDVNRLTASVVVPTISEVYLGLLQNCISSRVFD